MSVAAIIRDLVASGLSLEHALMAAEKFEAQRAEEAAISSGPVQRTPRQERNARYYEQNRARLAAERRLKASEITSENLKQDVSDVSDAETTESGNGAKEISPNPYKKTTSPSHHPSDDCPSPKKRRSQATAVKPHPIPADFWPTEADFSVVCLAGMPRPTAEAKVRQVVNYWIGRHEDNPRDAKAKKVNWGRAFQNSCLADIQRFGPFGVAGGGRPPPTGGGASRPRRSGPSMADLASVNSISDLFGTAPDAARDRQQTSDRADPADPRVQGFAGRLREQDRDHPGGEIVDFRRAHAG